MKEVKIIDHLVQPCPRCGGAHTYRLKGLVEKEDAKSMVLFGGPGDYAEWMLTCTVSNQVFAAQIPVPANTEITGLVTDEEMAQISPTEAVKDPDMAEMSEWVKNSRAIAVDFCKMMVTAALGAIPVYFAILKYLGLDTFKKTGQQFYIIPPVLFLISMLLYMLGLKPKFDSISPGEFTAFRQKRLRLLNQCLITGTIVFSIAVISGILIFFRGFLF